jgi:predicted  nucleic acid-binding Zn-ribbon protein
MPHQCVRCKKLYDDGSGEIIRGCSCGGKLFFYIKQEKLDELRNREEKKLTREESMQVEQDIMQMIGAKTDEPVILDFESVNVISPGKYEIDVVSLFQGKPLIFKVEDGKYVIDLPQTFGTLRSRRR